MSYLRSIAVKAVWVASVLYQVSAQGTDSSWTMWGGNLNNTRCADASTLISQTTVSNLAVAWNASVTGAVSASPLVHSGVTVFPTWAGHVYSLNSSTGNVVWQTIVDDYISSPLCEAPSEYNISASGVLLSRTTPALAGTDLIVIGTQFSIPAEPLAGLPYVMGELLAASCPLVTALAMNH